MLAKNIFRRFKCNMQIQNYNSKQNFTSIYRIKHSNIEAFLEINKYVYPAYKMAKRKPAFIFMGENPCDAFVAGSIKNHAEKFNYSYDWLVQNAKNHGLKIPNPQDIDAWVFTGENDANLVKNFLSDVIKKESSLWQIIKRTFNPQIDYNLPKHLREYSGPIKFNEEYTNRFRTLFDPKKIIDCKDVPDLYFKMLRE